MSRLLTLICIACSLLLLTSCVHKGYSKDEMVSLSGIESESVIKHLEKYSKKTTYSKAFAVDPIWLDHSWYFSGYRSKNALPQRVEEFENYALFAIGDQYVWPEHRDKYLASPVGQIRLCLKREDYKQALALAEEWLATREKPWRAYSLIAWAHYDMGDYSTASEYFDKSLEEKPDKNFSTIAKIECALLLGEFQKAKSMLDAITTKRMFTSGYRSMIVAYYAAVQDYEKAVSKNIYKGVRVGTRSHMNDTGLRITSVMPGCPAALAGLRNGDSITEFNGQTLAGLEFQSRFYELLAEVEQGEVVEIKFLRDGKAYRTQMVCGITTDILEKYRGLEGVRPVEM